MGALDDSRPQLVAAGVTVLPVSSVLQSRAPVHDPKPGGVGNATGATETQSDQPLEAQQGSATGATETEPNQPLEAQQATVGTSRKSALLPAPLEVGNKVEEHAESEAEASEEDAYELELHNDMDLFQEKLRKELQERQEERRRMEERKARYEQEITRLANAGSSTDLTAAWKQRLDKIRSDRVLRDSRAASATALFESKLQGESSTQLHEARGVKHDIERALFSDEIRKARERDTANATAAAVDRAAPALEWADKQRLVPVRLR